MYKIAIIPNPAAVGRLFSDKHLKEIAEVGDIVFNDKNEGITPELVKELIKDADIAITSWGCPRFTADILDAAPNLKLVVHAAGSVKGIVSQELWEIGIRVVSSAEALARGVAETTLGLMIASLKQMWWLNESIHNGEWSRGIEKVREVYELTVGIIGASRVGRHVIRLLRGFEVEVLVYDPFLTDEKAQNLGVRKVELEELMKQSDVVSVHAPEIPATYRMINRERIAMMKDNAILINTARGSIIDEAALAEELKTRRIYACIDVTDPEPPAADHPFRAMENVIMTPHIAGLTNNGLRRIGRYVSQEIYRYVNGEKLDGEVIAAMLDNIG